LKECPECGDENLQEVENKEWKSRERFTEDVTEEKKIEVTKHTIKRYWCSKCKKYVEPKLTSALPHATFGHRINALVTWLRFEHGETLSQVCSVFKYHLKSELSEGSVVEMGHRLAKIFKPWHEAIAERAKNSAVLHADETGWRVFGVTFWLWCFCSPRETYYLISGSRGSDVLSEFFTEIYDGVLVTDFWAAYNSVRCPEKQKCLPHGKAHSKGFQ